MKIKKIAKSPVAKVTAGLGAIATVLDPSLWLAVFDALLASGPQLFSVASVGALTLPQVLPPESTADWVVVAAGVLFVAYLAQRIHRNFESRGL